jgi:HAD superfamily hydrolase (TIGR01549 family)
MSPRGNYDAWLVDLDGTLYDARFVKLAMAAELALFGLTAIPTLRRFRQEHDAIRDLEAPDAGGPYALQLERTAASLRIDRAVVERRVSTWMIHRPGRWLRLFRRRTLLAEIASFHSAGGRTALVSDYPASEKLRAIGQASLFDVVVASGEPGGPKRLKPAPDGYLAAAERLGVPPARCLVLGDREDVDGTAARSAGMDFRQVA